MTYSYYDDIQDNLTHNMPYTTIGPGEIGFHALSGTTDHPTEVTSAAISNMADSDGGYAKLEGT